ncbi:MAG: PDDEXK nuclease domain-containing protein [Opitutaceae bacterium]
MKPTTPILAGYPEFFEDIKQRIQAAQVSAARAINRELILLYWDIGQGILSRQRDLGWGEAVVEALARDLRSAFPQTRGFSARNVWDMRRMAEAYSDPQFLRSMSAELRKSLPNKAKETGSALQEILRTYSAEIPWSSHVMILNKVADPVARSYYVTATAKMGWTRNVLLNQIKAQAYERTKAERKTHNFERALPIHLAEQADEALKSRYNLEFLGLDRPMRERQLEDRLIAELQHFILELGYGFCFVGRQHRLVLGQKEYFVDLLFYHRFLKALVAFDLKIGPFEPEFAGKMDFYLNLLNEKERAPDDQPSIGIVLCAEKDNLEVEFALKTKGNPIGVANYHLQPDLPTELKGKLPTARQLANAVRPMLPPGGR